MHKKIMEKCSSKLMKDANRYEKKAKHEKGIKKKHERIEEKEARAAARDMKMRAKKSHEY